MDTNNHSYDIGHYGVYDVVEMDGKTMVFGTPEGLMEKYQEVYKMINNDIDNTSTDESSTDCENIHVSKVVTDYFGNKSDTELNKLLLKVLKLEPDDGHMEMTNEEFEMLQTASDCALDVLADYQDYLVFTGSDEELVKELIAEYVCDEDWDGPISEETVNEIIEDANGPQPTYVIMDEIEDNKMYWNITTDSIDLSSTVVKKFLTEDEKEKYTEYFEKINLNKPDNGENNWEHSQYYVYIAGIRCAKGIVNGDIKCIFNTYVTDDYIY